MTLLRLSPDSERLRRIAKAHAAGELSTPEYRRIRADVIERFGAAGVEDQGDDTEPRWLERHTAAAIETDNSPARSSGLAAPRARLWWLAVAVSLIAIVIGTTRAWGSLPSTAEEPGIELPADQDLD
jgi:hypothetical protein